MTARELCEKVLALDAKATSGPWGYCYDGSSDFSVGQANDPQENRVASVYDRTKIGADAESIAHYRTAAPTLAKMLLKAIEALAKSIKCHEVLYEHAWHHAGLKAHDDIAYRESLEALAALDRIASGEVV